MVTVCYDSTVFPLLYLLISTLVGQISSFELSLLQKKGLQDMHPLNARAAKAKDNASLKPSLIVFDLDGCLWRPEMYELLWEGRGAGAPFQSLDWSRAKAKCGTVVELLGDVGHVLEELYSDPHWEDVHVGISSRTDEPTWAKDLLHTFKLPQSNVPIKSVFTGPWEISYDSKTQHFERISSVTGIPLESMLFFDNESGNCKSVSKQGVSVCYCPNGVTREVFKNAVECYPCTWGQVIGIDM